MEPHVSWHDRRMLSNNDWKTSRRKLRYEKRYDNNVGRRPRPRRKPRRRQRLVLSRVFALRQHQPAP